MGGFSNPIASGGGALIRESLHSPGHPEVPGWAINEDGSVEFSRGTFRGTVLSRQPGGRARRRADTDVFDIAPGTYPIGLLDVDYITPSDPLIALRDNRHFEIPRRGIYLCTGVITLVNDASGGRGLRLKRGDANTAVGAGNGIPFVSQAAYFLAGTRATQSCSSPAKLQAGDKVWLEVQSDVQFDLLSGGETTTLSVHYLSDTD